MLKDPVHSYQKPIFYDHDGSVDDFVALVNLLTLNQYRLTGISITNGNCYINTAVESTLRILDLFGRKEVVVAKSDEKAINKFPANWRRKNQFVNSIDYLANRQFDVSKISTKESADFMAEKILAEEEKTIILLTGPASNLVKTFEKYPEVKLKVEKVLWMAGAFLVDGNVKAPDHDGSAEWNIFWNPTAASKLLESGVPIFMFPLDSCRQLPVDNELMYHLKHSKKTLCKLDYQLFEPTYGSHRHYYMWDVLPTVYLRKPNLFQFEDTAIEVEKRGTSLGNIYRSTGGKKVKYSRSVNDIGFYDLLLKQLSSF